MVKRYLKIRFAEEENNDNRYVTGIGTQITLGKGFYAPPAFITSDIVLFGAIAGAAGGVLVRDNGADFNIEINNPCPEGTNLDPRKLKFAFSDGSTTEIPIRDTDDVVGVAQLIKDLWEAESATVTVVCVDLLGEEIANLNDELGVNFDPNQVENTAGNGKAYSGKVAYQDDAQQDTVVSVKVTVADNSAPPPIFGGVWDTCVDDFLDSRFSCGGSDVVKEHRRFIVQYQVTAEQDGVGNVPEQRELPIVLRDVAAAQACGQQVAQNGAVFCIGYRGETRRFIHKLLT